MYISEPQFHRLSEHSFDFDLGNQAIIGLNAEGTLSLTPGKDCIREPAYMGGPGPETLVSFDQKICSFRLKEAENRLVLVLADQCVLFFEYRAMRRHQKVRLGFLPSSVTTFTQFAVFGGQGLFQVLDIPSTRVLTKPIPVDPSKELLGVRVVRGWRSSSEERILLMFRDSQLGLEEFDMTVNFRDFDSMLSERRDSDSPILSAGKSDSAPVQGEG